MALSRMKLTMIVFLFPISLNGMLNPRIGALKIGLAFLKMVAPAKDFTK